MVDVGYTAADHLFTGHNDYLMSRALLCQAASQAPALTGSALIPPYTPEGLRHERSRWSDVY